MTYRAIIADPPWRYGSTRTFSRRKSRGDDSRSREGFDLIEYPTMPVDDLCRIEVPRDQSGCLLFLWTTNTFLANGDASRVCRSWGFDPVTILTWVKAKADGTPSMKMGHWFRGASEHVVFCKLGRMDRPRVPIPTWFSSGRLPHSVKPDLIHEMVEDLVPGGPYLEMFARRRRDGWDVWGNQVDGSITLDT